MSSAQSTAQLSFCLSLARRQALLDEAASILLGRATRLDLARARQLVEQAARIADEEAATLHRGPAAATLSTRAV